jgi:putative sigma-54 modulation protein
MAEGRPALNITITFRHMDGTEAVKRYAHDKVAKLQKYLRQGISAQVTLSVEGLQHIADVRLSAGSTHFQAEDRSEDMYASIDLVHDKLERQIRGAQGAMVAKRHGGTSAGEFAAELEAQGDQE